MCKEEYYLLSTWPAFVHLLSNYAIERTWQCIEKIVSRGSWFEGLVSQLHFCDVCVLFHRKTKPYQPPETINQFVFFFIYHDNDKFSDMLAGAPSQRKILFRRKFDLSHFVTPWWRFPPLIVRASYRKIYIAPLQKFIPCPLILLDIYGVIIDHSSCFSKLIGSHSNVQRYFRGISFIVSNSRVYRFVDFIILCAQNENNLCKHIFAIFILFFLILPIYVCSVLISVHSHVKPLVNILHLTWI